MYAPVELPDGFTLNEMAMHYKQTVAGSMIVTLKKVEKQNAERDKIESTKLRIDFGSQIRNYVFHPYKLVKDLRSGEDTSNVSDVMDGEIMPFIKAFLMMN